MKSVIQLTLKLVLAKQNNKVLEQESCQFGLFKTCKRKKKKGVMGGGAMGEMYFPG